ncbi:ArsC/Spx/MgsR family protein [Lactococcus petauri]|uniref:ArsC/Spx/MgsR family protein n=1 Tax=Lactococcus petauri TaxID=1940789 RepID=UPI00254CBACB|nr:ArsC/Spx/MgsR family protein [Lactococcus petauri]
MTRNDLVKLLKYSDEALIDILKHPGKSSTEVKDALRYVEILSFNEALDFLLSHPYVLQTPIIMDEREHLIGYNVDEIRKFPPKEYRRHNF